MRLKGLSVIFVLALISALVLGCAPTVVEVEKEVEKVVKETVVVEVEKEVVKEVVVEVTAEAMEEEAEAEGSMEPQAGGTLNGQGEAWQALRHFPGGDRRNQYRGGNILRPAGRAVVVAGMID